MPPRPDQSAWRRCLGPCGRKFRSRDAAHRICPKCDRTLKNQREPRTSSGTVYVGGTSLTITPED